MPWYFPGSDAIKKRACRYLLQRYMGQFLQEKLTLDQLSVDLYNGTGTIKDLDLDVKALNEILDNASAPFEIVDGFVGEITVGIPWSNLTSDSTEVDVTGLELTVQPKQRDDNGIPLDTMFTSMTTSIQLAEEVLKQEPSEGERQAETAKPFEGVEKFAQTIESVLSRVKVNFTDTTVRLEHLPKEAKKGVALEVKIKRIEYFDEAASEQGSPVDQPNYNVYEPVPVAHKMFHITGIVLYSDEFPDENRTFCRNSESMMASYSKSPVSGLQLSPPITEQPKKEYNLQGPEKSTTTEPLQIGTIQGKQTIKMKIKQNENVPGPKFELDCQIGSINLFMCPRQVHILMLLVEGLSSPSSCDNSNTTPRGGANKPMCSQDFSRVEHDLQCQMSEKLYPGHEPLYAGQHCWKEGDETMTHSHSLDDSDDDLFLSLGSSNSGMNSLETSFTDTASQKSASSASTNTLRYSYGTGYLNTKNDSPFSSSIPPGARKPQPRHRKDSRSKLLEDPAAEQSIFKLKVSLISVTVLHEDPTPTPADSLDGPGKTAAEKVRDMAAKYFGGITNISVGSMGTDLKKFREEICRLCQHDHIGLLGKPLSIHCVQKSSPVHHGKTVTADITIGLLEMVESVFDRRSSTSSLYGFSLPVANKLPTHTELLVFYLDEDLAPGQMYASMMSTPAIKVKVDNWETTSQRSHRRSSHSPKTGIHVELGRFRTEFDITLVDRINALLNPQPLESFDPIANRMASINYSINTTRQVFFNQAIEEGPAITNRKLDIHVTSKQADLLVRFPIPDLRQGHNVDKFPWWVRRVHPEVLTLELHQATFHTEFTTGDQGMEVEFTSKEAYGLFQETESSPKVKFLYVKHDDGEGEGFEWPRLVIRQQPPAAMSVLNDIEDSEDTTPHDSLNGACDKLTKTEPSPFASKKIMYESEEFMKFSDIVENETNSQENNSSAAPSVGSSPLFLTEMVTPGEKEEIKEFVESAKSNCNLCIDLSLPYVNILLPSKEFFEKIYNRLNNDLLLWESLAPAPLNPQEQFGLPLQFAPGLDLASQLLQQAGNTDKFSMCKSGKLTESSSDSEEEESMLYSIHDRKLSKRKQRPVQQHQRSKLYVSLGITKGSLTACVPLKDDQGAISTTSHGEFHLDLDEGSLFCVVAYNGNPDLRYLCVGANNATLYHKGCVPNTEFPSINRPFPVHHLNPCIYLSEEGVVTRLSGQVGRGIERSKDMVSVAIKIKSDLTKNVKEFVVAVAIRGGTLQHKMALAGQSWLSQALSFLDVKDYPIHGYTMPGVITELHTHLYSCAIDYRPLRSALDLRAMLTVEHFSISSNIVAESPTSLLRFIIDDGALYLSKKCDVNKVDLRRNYVCVLDVGMFELALRSSEGKDLRYAKTDLRASNNILHIRTCSDSFKALQDLIVHYANDGDLQQPEETKPRTSYREKSPDDVTRDANPPSDDISEELNTMLTDAMMESHGKESTSDSIGGTSVTSEGAGGTELFFVPSRDQQDGSVFRQITAIMTTSEEESVSSSTLSERLEEEEGSDEDFCIIDEPGLGIVPRDGEPTVKVLTESPITIKDDHFKCPLVKTDQLKAPEHFPPAVYRYTLKEMSVVWHMYGGTDLTDSREKSRHLSGSRLGKVGWQARGGPGRDLDTLMELQLNKVRLQHEIYPDNTAQASRQIMIINDIEVRDRLTSSKINKFLYQYTSEALPKQTHANMVVVKAVHVRPDQSATSEECSLRVSLQPLRLNIDQDSLFFLHNFFNELFGSDSSESSLEGSGKQVAMAELSSSPAKAPSPPPVMTMGGGGEDTAPPDPQELAIMFDEIQETVEGHTDEEEDRKEGPSQPVYFKTFVFSPEVPIRFDYHGKHFSTEHGKFAGLLAGLAQLNCSEIKLKKLNYKAGLLGFDRLVKYALEEWLNDVKKNQLLSILGGVGPMHSFVQLVQGVKDLFWLPIEQYKKDGRIVRGLQRGANSFTTSTAMATLELTNRLVQTIQGAAELTFDMVSPSPGAKHAHKPKQLQQPADLREGIANAATVIKEGVTDTAHTIARVASEEHELKGMTGAVGGVLRQVPGTVVQPVILATKATSNVLGGMRNQLQVDARKEMTEKWKANQE